MLESSQGDRLDHDADHRNNHRTAYCSGLNSHVRHRSADNAVEQDRKRRVRRSGIIE
jgi:hypothetical protein